MTPRQLELPGSAKMVGVRMHIFDGETFDRKLDQKRLSTQLGKVVNLMSDGTARSLSKIAFLLSMPEASVSARLRDCRKVQVATAFGIERVDSLRRDGGLWEYRLLMKEQK